MMNPISNPLSHLRSLVDAVRGMGLGDPDDPAADRILASDVVRWAADEIARLSLTDKEREAIKNACKLGTFPDEIATIKGFLDRTS